MNDKPKFILNENGVFYTGNSSDEPVWLSSHIKVIALTRDENNENWGKLIELKDSDGNIHMLPIPNSMFAGDCREIRERLLEKGAHIVSTPALRNKFNDYLNMEQPPERTLCVTQTGWYKNAFILPEQSFGNTESVYFQSERPINFYTQKGTLDEWRDKIGQYCRGNNKLLFATSLAFAAPLMGILGIESGGFHFFGPSSCGKSTALRVAASVYGAQDYIKTWRATDNGLEGIATAHNDTLLILDEMGQISGHILGDTVYMLANGEGKSRANKYGNARPTKRWRLAILSSGEITLDDHMRSAGKSSKAGQDIRLISIPAVASGAQYGVFETIHDFKDGAEFSKYLCQAVNEAYGTPFIEFVKRLVEDVDQIPDKFDNFFKHNRWFVPSGTDGQVLRAMFRFMLVAFAGELATEYGITGWECGSITSAAKDCFHEWLSVRGTLQSQETKRTLEQVKRFFETNKENFVDSVNGTEPPRPNIAGYKTDDDLLVLPETFKKTIVCGLNPKTAIKVLSDRGWLITNPNDPENRNTWVVNIAKHPNRVYKFSHKIWVDDIDNMLEV